MKSVFAYVEAWKKPLGLIALSLFYFVMTLIRIPFSPSLLRFSKFRNKWFGLMWRRIGPQMAAEPIQDPYIGRLLQTAEGTVLELGPGTGDQSHHYDTEKIDALYGAEPNKDLHEQLRKKNYGLGLAGNYTILTAGAEPQSLIPALVDAGLLKYRSGQSLFPEEGVFDCIVAVKSLCSIDPAEMRHTVDTIFKLLKPGGQFIFFEHVHSNADLVTSTGVWFANIIWPYLMGNCHLDSKLDEIVNGMTEWKSKDVRVIAVQYLQRTGHLPMDAIPEAIGSDDGGPPVLYFREANGSNEYLPLYIRGLKEIRVRLQRKHRLEESKRRKRRGSKSVSISQEVELHRSCGEDGGGRRLEPRWDGGVRRFQL